MKSKNPEWQNNILVALKSAGYKTDMLEYLLLDDDWGQGFMQTVATNRSHYEYLDSLGLVNTGICPIMGEPIVISYQYTIFGRTIFLSDKGMELCQAVNRQQSEVRIAEQQARRVENEGSKNSQPQGWADVFLLIASFLGCYFILLPSGIKGYLLLLFVGSIAYAILAFMWSKIASAIRRK